MRGPVASEAQEHAALANWLSLIERRTPGLWWTTIPLGGGGRIRGAQIKRAGARKGTPDLLIVYRGRTVFIELKRQRLSRVQPEQAACHADIILAGGAVFIAKGAQAAINFINDSVLAGAA